MIIDLRSDTITRPTEEMREAMFQAQVGDDVFGEDPSVNALQDKLAGMFGMEAGLFCPSGTMCNQIAIRTHTQPQDQLICDHRSHIYLYEGGGIAYNSMVSVKTVDGDRGRLNADQVRKCINPDDIHLPRTALVVLENTSNKGGGSYYDLSTIASIGEVCQAEGLKLHLDGARVFNALVETGDDPRSYGRYFDSISICLSKGLGAPVGSVLVGSREMIERALRVRKVLGGGMRQGGYLAAAGIYALDHHIYRLKEDHRKARLIGEALNAHPGIREVLPVDTNIVIFSPDPAWMTAPALLAELDHHGVKGVQFGPEHLRLTTHLDINTDMMDRVLEVIHNLEHTPLVRIES